MFDKPYTAGITIFYQRYSYDQARQESLLSGENLLGYFNSIGTQNLLNYVSNGRGVTVFVSHPLKRRSFARIGLTYGYSVQNLSPLTNAATNYFDYLDFEGIAGPNSFDGIHASTFTPTFAYNTVNHPITPTHGLRLNPSFAFTGSVLGGNVNTMLPSIDAAYFHPSPYFKKVIVGMHLTGRFIGGLEARLRHHIAAFTWAAKMISADSISIRSARPLIFLPAPPSPF